MSRATRRCSQPVHYLFQCHRFLQQPGLAPFSHCFSILDNLPALPFHCPSPFSPSSLTILHPPHLLFLPFPQFPHNRRSTEVAGEQHCCCFYLLLLPPSHMHGHPLLSIELSCSKRHHLSQGSCHVKALEWRPEEPLIARPLRGCHQFGSTCAPWK